MSSSIHSGGGRNFFAIVAFVLSCLGSAAFAADPQISSFIDNPDPVPAGGNVTYTARITNSALDDATSVVLSVPVPAGASFVSATAPCALSAGVVSCALGTVAGSDADVRLLDFVFRALGPGPTSITATATLSAGNDTNPANNVQSQTTTVVQGGNLALTKSGTPNPVVGGANLTYTLTASNAGPNTSAAIVVTDNLPPSVSFVSAAGSGWSCSHAAGVVTCSHAGPHAAGAPIAALSIVGKVNASGGTVTNVATVAPAVGGTADPDNSDNTATVDTVVLPGADVRIAQKTVTSGTPAIAGQNVTFQIQPRNSGPAGAVNAVVTDNLPAGWTFVSAAGPNWPCTASGQAVSCTRASFPSGAVDNITVVATAPGNATVGPTGTIYTNTATIASGTTDPTPGNNSGSANINVLPDGADLRISKSKTPNPVALGGTLTSTIRVTNNGPRIATGPLRVVELLAGETFVGASGSGWSCDASAAPTIVCNHANAGHVAVGASLPDLVLTSIASVAGALSNNACTGASVPAGAAGGTTASPPVEGDPNPGNDCASASSTSTTTQPDLGITKVTSTPTGGDKIVSTSELSVTYTLVVSNLTAPGSDTATGIVIRDTVPAFIGGRTTINAVTATVSGGTATFSCAIVAAAVTCTQNGGALAPGEAVTVPITVNRPMSDGSFTNTATVSNTAEGDPNAANNSASDTVTIQPIADLQMTGKTATPAAIRAGEQSTYVLSYRNNGPSPALAVALTDQFTFPAGDSGLTVVSIASSKGGSTCTIAAGAVLAPGSDNFSCSIGSMANAETQTVTLAVRPNFQPGNATRSFANTASVTTTTVENPAGGDNGNNSQSATLTVNPAQVDLLTNKIDYVDPVPFAGNAFIDYRVLVTNNGPSYATNVRISETMTPPAAKRIRFVCDTTGPASAVCNATSLCSTTNVTSAPGTPLPTFTCDVPTGTSTTGLAQRELASGQSKPVYLRFEVLDTPAGSGDVFSNRASVSANEPDTFPGNDTSTEQTTVRQRIDLAVAKSATPSTVTLRQPFIWTVTVTNNGPGNSQRTDLTDTLPAGVVITGPITFSSTSPVASGSCALAGSTVSCSLGVLNNAGVATVTIPARMDTFPSVGTLTNSATVDTDPNKLGGIDPVPGNNTGTSVVTVTRSSLTGIVFQDRDRAGANAGTPQAPASEPRIAGVTLTLTGTDAYGNAVNVPATTNASGVFTFTDLSPSDASGYMITETQPTGFVNSPASPPSSGGSAPSLGGSYAAGGQAGNSSFATIPVGAADSGTNYNFPEVRRPSLSGFVYIDVNLNGVRDAGTDIAIAGATVRLLDAASLAVLATTTTDATGAYSFVNLDPLVAYTLEEPLPSTPAGLKNGPVNPGLVNGAACASGCTAQPNTPVADTDRIAAIDLGAGTDGTAFNFGEQQQTTISGLVFVDTNRNNALDPGEAGRVAGVTVRLVQGADCTSGTTLRSTTTAVNGTYAFVNVLAFQNYLVCETQPAGYGTGSAHGTPGSNVIAIANLPSAGSANNLFGETLAQITGSVYQDTGAGTPANFNNGNRDAGEPGIVNVPVTLTGSDQFGTPVSLTVSTDASGNYSFDSLFPPNGTGYTISEGAIPPASGTYLQGKDAAGSAGGNATLQDVISGVALAAGQQASGYLFGELPQASIGGTVYVDRNRNDTLDPTPTDGRIAGVTMRLVQGADCASGTTLQTVTSAADGSYNFASVAAGGSYLVCETQPAGYANGIENPGTNGTTPGPNVISIANLPASGSTGNHFGERVASLAGSVYQDYTPAVPANTNNGVRDAGEAGIANVPVTLAGHDINGASVNVTVTTDASGNYRFDDLLQSDATGYTVAEGAIPPASGNYVDGKETAGTLGGSIAVNDRIGPVVVPAGAVATGYLFGELPIAPITGTVYLDRNRNGALDPTPSDGRIANVTVRLEQGASCAGGTVLQSTLTGADGSYAFSGAAAGQNYLVCETQPAGYAEGSVNPGTSASTPATNTILITNLPAAGSAGNHFGERAGSISGNVFLDANDDGQRLGDIGLAGITITLSGVDAAGAPVSRTTTTDAGGAWRFDDVLGAGAGGYAVTEQAAQPVVAGKTTLNGKTTAGTAGGTATPVATVPSAIASIGLAVGVDSSENNFAEILPVTIAGTVFIDLNNNGVQNLPGDAGIGNVALVVTGTDDTGAAVTRNIATAADGTYSLVELRPGTYTVTEPTQPPGTTNGQTIAGSAGGTATTPATTPSAISGVVLTTPGASGSGYNFAEIPNTSAVSGRVWLDLDNNGAINGSEVGIAGVTVALTGTDLGGAAVSRTTTTDASGAYAFANLAPGTYGVTEPTQPTSTLNGTTVAGSAGGTATGVATTPSAVSGIALGVGQTSSANNFGELPTASIGGHVIGDSNNNGRLDPGESGLANVAIVLSGTDDQGNAVSAATTSDASGAYVFAGLRPGNYTLTEPTQPPGTVNGITTAGTVNGTSTGAATAPSTTPSAIAGLVLPPGGASINNDFAEVGNSPDLLVTKASVEARFTVNNVGTYAIRVRNGGEVATSAPYRVSDRLPAGLTLASVPLGTGWSCTGAIGASTFTCTSSDVIAAGAINPGAITVKIRVAAIALQDSPAINAVMVDGGGELPARAPSAAELDAFNNAPGSLPPCAPGIVANACRSATPVQASASISGTTWYDIGTSRGLLDAGDRRLAGWQVEVLDASGTIVARAVTAADGTYRISDLPPGIELHVRFRDPASNVVWGYPVNGETSPGPSGAACNTTQAIASGTASSCPGSGADPSLDVVLAPGQNLPQQSLPVDPSGVVYDSGTRQPVPGSVVTLAPVGTCAGWNPATGLVAATLGGYSVNAGAVSMTVGPDGFYQFLFAPAAPASCTFSLTVAPPAGYTFVSVLIPPSPGPLVAPGGAGTTTLVQAQAGPPTGAVGPATSYYISITAGSATANVIHNHLPVDPATPTGLSLSKTGDKQLVEVGDSVRYTITVQRSSGPVPRQVTVVDRLPAGFTFIAGTAVVNGTSVADPAGKPGPALTFNLGAMPASGQLVLQYRIRVGVGAQQSDGINRAIGYGCGVPAGCTAGNGTTPLPGSAATNEGRFQVRIGGGVFTTAACLLGKIFVDCNGNHIQDEEEIGIPGVRLVISDGTTLISDSEGKYSYCGLAPKSHVIRVDETTLPRGSRLTTSSNRNLGDAGSLWLDLKNGELARADFIEGSCSPTVLDQVKARRAQGEIRSIETEKKSLPALKFDSKDKGPRPRTEPPAQANDGSTR